MSKYNGSNRRMLLLVLQFACIVYTIMEGKPDARILDWMIFPLWALAVNHWHRAVQDEQDRENQDGNLDAK